MPHQKISKLGRELGLSADDIQRFQDVVDSLTQGDVSAQESSLVEPDEQATIIFEPVSLHEQAAGEAGSSLQPANDSTGMYASVSATSSLNAGFRYEMLGRLGVGGMGKVERVRDCDLNRSMAMKVIRAEQMERPAALARFIEEAQATAQLQHPGIVPVHEMGRLTDGRVYFTMKEVRGRTLSEVIDEVHQASPESTWEVGPTGWSFHRLVDAFHRSCEAVAYAHGRGVVHRDLKPDNIMVGEHGEVMVLDWGLAKVTGRPDLAAQAGELDPVATDRSKDDAMATRMGAVAGTPAYMSPEQARGEVDRIDARTDVYALGALLYQILSGRSPYEGSSGQMVLAQVKAGPPLPPGRMAGASSTIGFDLDDWEDVSTLCGPPLPEELVAACNKAMARDPDHRFVNASDLADEVAAWLEGLRQRQKALEIAARADDCSARVVKLREQADSLLAASHELLKEVAVWQPVEDKLAGWAKEDAAFALEREVAHLILEREQLLQGALTHAPDLLEAHRALATMYRESHQVAEQARDPSAAVKAEVRLRTHADYLSEIDPERIAHLEYLEGTGALSLVTDPPGAEVRLHRYEVRHRRLEPVFDSVLGHTPIERIPLPMGSFLLTLHLEGRAEVRYPVFIEREQHWDGVDPDGQVQPIYLPAADELAEDDCYVPQGWTWIGGDTEAVNSLPRHRWWVDAFVCKRHPVTNQEYVAFLDDLVARGKEDEALRLAPREQAVSGGSSGGVIYGRTSDGRFRLVADSDGDLWLPEWPVVMVQWECALAYTRWLAEKEGQDWRLPAELEWEKAARGVDGRFHPWGDFMDPAYCCIRESTSGRPLPAEAALFPLDESAYGIRGLGGNARDWCLDVFSKTGPVFSNARAQLPSPSELSDLSDGVRRVCRGGNFFGLAEGARSARRSGDSAVVPYPTTGFRCSRSIHV